MCLITTKNIPEIAQKDIVCYKFYVLHKVKDDINLPSYDKDGYLSPYQGMLAPKINEVVNTVLDRVYLCKCGGNNSTYMINRGFHSFKYIDDLTKELYFWQSSDIKIFKCIIPKGNKYYEGKFDDFPSYCSESIILKEIINVKW